MTQPRHLRLKMLLEPTHHHRPHHVHVSPPSLVTFSHWQVRALSLSRTIAGAVTGQISTPCCLTVSTPSAESASRPHFPHFQRARCSIAQPVTSQVTFAPVHHTVTTSHTTSMPFPTRASLSTCVRFTRTSKVRLRSRPHISAALAKFLCVPAVPLSTANPAPIRPTYLSF